MNKNLLVFSGCALALLLSSPAYSAEAAVGPYVSGNLGLAMPRDSESTFSGFPGITSNTSYDTGWTLGAALGYNFGNTRLEGEVAYQKTNTDKITLLGTTWDANGDISALSYLVNGYYDFTNSSAFTPYLTAGLGFAKIKWTEDNESADDTVFAYQVGAGVGYALSKNVTLDVKYRYFATADPTFFDTVNMEFASHNLLLGVRVNF